MQTLIQRLRLDSNIGYNYDYMGYAEYEQGDTARTRAYLAAADSRNELLQYHSTLRSHPVTYIFVSPKNQAETGAIRATIEAMERGEFRNKGHLGSIRLSPGYLMLAPIPMLIVEPQFVGEPVPEDRIKSFLGSVEPQIITAGYAGIQEYLDAATPVYGVV